jgi:hypothetical protein
VGSASATLCQGRGPQPSISLQNQNTPGRFHTNNGAVITTRELLGARHHLRHFALASIHPGVLTAFYRVSVDLWRVKTIANHTQLSATVSYLEKPEVQAQNRLHLAMLQDAFIGRLQHPPPNTSAVSNKTQRNAAAAVPRYVVVSMFGFNCKDPFAGIALGTRRGELCTNFLGCFTCPNAMTTADAASVARLLQCRDHLRSARAYLHPARWEVIYAPQLRILEEDILTRFSGRDLAAAAPLHHCRSCDDHPSVARCKYCPGVADLQQ